MKWVKKALCCPNNGQDVFYADFDYRNDKDVVPPIWYLKTPHFSLLEGEEGLPARTVALFNLSDEEQEINLTAEKLNLEKGNYLITDIWSLETKPISEFAKIKLPRRSSRLLSISHEEGLQVLDSNMKINSIRVAKENLSINIAYKGDLELVLNFKPSSFEFDGQELPVEVNENGNSFVVAGKISDSGKLIIKK
jgi:hypothetical protein